MFEIGRDDTSNLFKINNLEFTIYNRWKQISALLEL